MLEAAVHPASSFVTLTYDKEHINGAGSLVPNDLQLWLKRYRHAAGRIRYYAVGEYGEVSMRPHYHLALFGSDKHTARRISQSTWDAGLVHTGELTRASAQYICGYVTKKMTRTDDARLGNRHPEFARMSLRPGIGAPSISTLVSALSHKHAQRDMHLKGDVPQVLRHGRHNLPLGRYMRNRLRTELGLDNLEQTPEETFKKTAELYNMYQYYAADETEPLGMAAWSMARDENALRKIEKRYKLKEHRRI